MFSGFSSSYCAISSWLSGSAMWSEDADEIALQASGAVRDECFGGCLEKIGGVFLYNLFMSCVCCALMFSFVVGCRVAALHSQAYVHIFGVKRMR